MADIVKTELIDPIRNLYGLQNSQDPINKIAHYVQPTHETFKFANKIYAGTNSVTADNTITTLPTDRDFYVTAVQLTLTVNAACDNVSAQVVAPIGGANTYLIRIDTQTLTAGSYNAILPLPFPIKIDRGGIIKSVGTFTVGALTKSAIVYGVLI